MQLRAPSCSGDVPSFSPGQEIDALVYGLHGLTEEEITIVEGRDH